MKTILTIALCVCTILTAKAQTFFKDGNGKYGLKNIAGKVLIAGKYDAVDGFLNGLAAVVLNGKMGLIDKTGKEIVPPKYDAVDEFHDGLAAVMLNKKVGFIDKTGKEIIPPKYDFYDLASKGCYQFSEGLAAVSVIDDFIGSLVIYKWGFIDKTGKETIPLEYDYVEKFTAGKAKVSRYREEFYIDKTGRKVK